MTTANENISQATASTQSSAPAVSSTDLRGALEALLFVSDEPVSAVQLSRILDCNPGEIEELLTTLAHDYEQEARGFQLREVAGGWRLYTHPAYSEVIEAYVLSWDTRKLSQAALEALAAIAYKQPVTRAGINAVRGVNSEGVVSSLIEKGLVRELGRDTKQGNAILYGTTNTFLEKFGLKNLAALPPLEDFAPDAQTQATIKKRLGASEETGETEDQMREFDQASVDDDEVYAVD